MLTMSKLHETIIINEMINYIRMSPKDMYESLKEHSEDENLLPDMPINFIRRLCISIHAAFREQGIMFFTFNPKLSNIHVYQVTQEARTFANENLLQPMYDENGENINFYFEHPDMLKEEWRELI